MPLAQKHDIDNQKPPIRWGFSSKPGANNNHRWSFVKGDGRILGDEEIWYNMISMTEMLKMEYFSWHIC